MGYVLAVTSILFVIHWIRLANSLRFLLSELERLEERMGYQERFAERAITQLQNDIARLSREKKDTETAAFEKMRKG